MKKKKQEMYSITLKGLLQMVTQDEEMTEKLWDAIELYSLRHKKNGVIVKDGGIFIEVEIAE